MTLSTVMTSRGRVIVMGDSDDSYDFLAIRPFVEKVEDGYNLVMGSRFKGGIEPSAMPPLHRYLGNPVLTAILNVFFHTRISDAHCGMRAFSRQAFERMALKTGGMEFASEMIVRAAQEGLRITEIPTRLAKDGRDRKPHLRSFPDGWRHLRFLLVFAPRRTLVQPGFALAAIGLIATVALALGPVRIGSVTFDINALAYSCLAVLVGWQTRWAALALALFCAVAAIFFHYLPAQGLEGFERMGQIINFQKNLAIAGGFLLLAAFGPGRFSLDARTNGRLATA